MLMGGLKLITNQPQPEQPSAEGVFLVGGLGFGAAGAALVERLSANRQRELDICLDFSGVERTVEQPEFHRAFFETQSAD